MDASDDTPKIHVGTAGFTEGPEYYARKLAFVEISLREPVPTAKTLAGWRKQVGDAFVFAVSPGTSFWGDKEAPLRDAASIRDEVRALRTTLRTLDARVLLLRSPSVMRPGSAAIGRLLALAPTLAELAPVIAWEPAGLWQRDQAVRAVEQVDWVVVSDPLRDDASDQPTVYARMRGLGADRRYHTGRLEDLAEALEDIEEGFVVFATDTGFRDASRFVNVLAGAVDAADENDDEDDDDAVDDDAVDDDADDEG